MRWMHRTTLRTETSSEIVWNCSRQLSDSASSPAVRRTIHTESPSTIGAELVTQTTRSCRVADRWCCRDATPATGWHNSTRYWGAWLCRQLNIMTLSLYTTRPGTSSQCSSVWRSRDKPRSNLWVPLTTFSEGSQAISSGQVCFIILKSCPVSVQRPTTDGPLPKMG